MKLVNALLLPAFMAQRASQEESFEPSRPTPPPDAPPGDGFKSTGYFDATHDPSLFDRSVETNINLSSNLANARDVEMHDLETLNEDSADMCGLHGCTGSWKHVYPPSQAINGEPLRQRSVNVGQNGSGMYFASKWSNAFSQAWVADINNSPAVGFVKVWPPINARYDYSTWVQWQNLRVFVNDQECFAIEYYDTNKIKEIFRQPSYDYEALVWNCPTWVENANKVIVHGGSGYHTMSWKEVEIFAPNGQQASPVVEPVVHQIPVDQANMLATVGQFHPEVKADKVASHGCHCAKYSRNEFVGGPPVDNLDSLCQQWNMKNHCLTLPGGACENGIDFTFFNVKVHGDDTPNDDADFACENTESDCEKALCLVNFEFAKQLWTSAEAGEAGSDSYWYDENATCTPNAPVNGIHTCVGDSPNVRINTEIIEEEVEIYDPIPASIDAGVNWIQLSTGRWIHVGPDNMNWEDSKNYCYGLVEGSTMAISESDAENAEMYSAMKEFLATSQGDMVWLGLQRDIPSPDYYRTDGKPYTYANFCPGAHPGGATGAWTTGSNDRATINPWGYQDQTCWDDIWGSFSSWTRPGCMYDPNASSGAQETPSLDLNSLNGGSSSLF